MKSRVHIHRLIEKAICHPSTVAADTQLLSFTATRLASFRLNKRPHHKRPRLKRIKWSLIKQDTRCSLASVHIYIYYPHTVIHIPKIKIKRGGRNNQLFPTVSTFSRS